jgi:hypothetical protein
MAKKKTTRPAGMNKRIRERDKVTMSKIVDLADNVANCAFRGRDVCVEIPTRTRSNTIWNKKRGILQMGSGKATRELFNLNGAKQFMQTCLHGNSIKELIDAEKSLSLRGMYYKGLHTVAGTKEKTFTDQSESDGILEDLEVTMGSLREELHIFAENRGAMVGNITVVDKGDEIDCRRMGSAVRDPEHHRAGRDRVQEDRRRLRPARRKRHGLEPLQRRPLLGEARLHPDATAAASRRAACGGCSSASARRPSSDHLPARLRPVGALHLQRHQAGLDLAWRSSPSASRSRRRVPRASARRTTTSAT